jgi:hypothetical protein
LFQFIQVNAARTFEHDILVIAPAGEKRKCKKKYRKAK